MSPTRILSLLSAALLVGVVSPAAGQDSGREKHLHARLSGANEVPAVSSTGHGELRAKIDQDDMELTYELSFEDLEGTVLQSHIHLGQTAVNGGIHGMTANAFTSASLDPPLVLVSIGRQARMHAHLLQGTRFGVSVLSQDQLGYAWHFAGRAQEGWQPAFTWRGEVPLVAEALAQFVCTVETSYPGGDHTLFLGRVEDLWHRDGSPLTFYRGHFFGLIPLPAGLWMPAAEATG